MLVDLEVFYLGHLKNFYTIQYNTILQHSIMLWRLFSIVECGIACFLCAMCVFEIRASSSSPGYHCAKFRFFCGLHCWASPWRKIAYSITHQAYLMPWELKHLHFAIMFLWIMGSYSSNLGFFVTTINASLWSTKRLTIMWQICSGQRIPNIIRIGRVLQKNR